MKRIMVVGCTGSGKSTFSIRTTCKTGIELIHLDNLFYNSDGTHQVKEDWVNIIENLSKKEEWIMDGNYAATLKLRAKYADTIFLLDIPR